MTEMDQHASMHTDTQGSVAIFYVFSLILSMTDAKFVRLDGTPDDNHGISLRIVVLRS